MYIGAFEIELILQTEQNILMVQYIGIISIWLCI